MRPNILSIAGSDPSGGAGIQADLKTFAALGAYGMAAVTTLTAQNTQGVSGTHTLPPSFVKEQIKAVFDDIDVHAVKIGLLGNVEICHAVADVLDHYKPPLIVFDPVLVAQSGDGLTEGAVTSVMAERFFPIATVVTPNIPEAMAFTGMTSNENNILAYGCLKQGARAVLLKGGHDGGNTCRDVLVANGQEHTFEHERIDTQNTHGTGCTLSSALAVFLAKGYALEDACKLAKEYLTVALISGKDTKIGRGHGPVDHSLSNV